MIAGIILASWNNSNSKGVAMKNQLAKIAAAVGFLITSATPILAQQSKPVPAGDRVQADKIRQQDMSRRELQLRSVGSAPKEAADPKQLHALMAEVDQDFKRILVLHNEIARAISSNKVVDYRFISDATAEIRKRASRLQTILALHRPEGSEQNQRKRIEFNDAQVKDALITLCKQIKSFVTNPVIENPGTVNVQQLTRASSDLEAIIELSGSLKKTAERLNKIPK
jgi:hypothetical protein